VGGDADLGSLFFLVVTFLPLVSSCTRYKLWRACVLMNQLPNEWVELIPASFDSIQVAEVVTGAVIDPNDILDYLIYFCNL
jgi:hypothetical protein